VRKGRQASEHWQRADTKRVYTEWEQTTHHSVAVEVVLVVHMLTVVLALGEQLRARGDTGVDL
jgi:hypothetical protein